jgi:hypothetical protein
MRRSFIIGNGFISHLAQLVQDRNEELYIQLKKVEALFNQFQSLESELRSLLNITASNEIILGITENLVNWYRQINSESGLVNNSCFDALADLGKIIIEDKIAPIVKGFEQQQIDGTYGDLTRVLSQFNIGDKVKQGLESDSELKLGLFTTNYDGFLEQMLRTTDGSGYYFTDGFAGLYPYPLKLYTPYISDKAFLGHLHSSYRYSWCGSTCIKTRDFTEAGANRDPILVYASPSKKKEFIDKNPLLSRYWYEFEKWLNLSDEIVIFGNSMMSDPHILELVVSIVKFKQEIKLIIVAKNECKLDLYVEIGIPREQLIFIKSEKINLANYHLFFLNPESI